VRSGGVRVVLCEHGELVARNMRALIELYHICRNPNAQACAFTEGFASTHAVSLLA
jgi:hypothetical protein